jgi:hypothetical protein
MRLLTASEISITDIRIRICGYYFCYLHPHVRIAVESGYYLPTFFTPSAHACRM